MRYTFFDTKRDTLYINSNLILPDTKGMKFRDHCKKYDEAFAKSYEERLQEYCPQDIRVQIQEELDKHPGCKISEFDDL